MGNGYRGGVFWPIPSKTPLGLTQLRPYSPYCTLTGGHNPIFAKVMGCPSILIWLSLALYSTNLRFPCTRVLDYLLVLYLSCLHHHNQILPRCRSLHPTNSNTHPPQMIPASNHPPSLLLTLLFLLSNSNPVIPPRCANRYCTFFILCVIHQRKILSASPPLVMTDPSKLHVKEAAPSFGYDGWVVGCRIDAYITYVTGGKVGTIRG
jgi:hypothetical protein